MPPPRECIFCGKRFEISLDDFIKGDKYEGILFLTCGDSDCVDSIKCMKCEKKITTSNFVHSMLAQQRPDSHVYFLCDDENCRFYAKCCGCGIVMLKQKINDHLNENREMCSIEFAKRNHMEYEKININYFTRTMFISFFS